MKNKGKKGSWSVELKATDGRQCCWIFEKCTLSHVRDLVRSYVSHCPYDCKWTIRGGADVAMLIEGETKTEVVKEKIHKGWNID